MLRSGSGSSPIELGRVATGDARGVASVPRPPEQLISSRSFPLGSFLCVEGSPRSEVFQIERGLVSYWRGTGKSPQFCFATAGDYIGLGCLDRYVYSAKAIAETETRCVAASAFEHLAASSPEVRSALGRAIELEFQTLKEQTVRLAPSGPFGVEQKVAALLVVLSRNNSYEGRDPSRVTDDLSCGSVASQLGIDIDDLEEALASLKRRGLLALDGGNLSIVDMAALDRLADGHLA